MENQLTPDDTQRIREGIRGKYIQVATSPAGHFTYPTGREGMVCLGYSSSMLASLPDRVADAYCGVGNPFSLGEIHDGEAVLDMGCGAGVDAIWAAQLVGPAGSVVGIDMVPEMIERSQANLKETSLDNVRFILSSAENAHFEKESFDVVISNGVFNLIPDKESAIAAVFRFLKPGGRFMIADQVMIGKLQKNLKSRIDTWFQ